MKSDDFLIILRNLKVRVVGYYIAEKKSHVKKLKGRSPICIKNFWGITKMRFRKLYKVIKNMFETMRECEDYKMRLMFCYIIGDRHLTIT